MKMWLKLTDKAGESLYVNMDTIEIFEAAADGPIKTQLIIHNHPEGYSYAVQETPEQIAEAMNINSVVYNKPVPPADALKPTPSIVWPKTTVKGPAW